MPFRGQRAVIVMGDTHRDKLIADAFPYSPLVEYTLAVMNASLAAMNMNVAAEALGVSSVMLLGDGAQRLSGCRLPEGESWRCRMASSR